ncbi:MAG TPA: GMC family oxidoreductase [Candidatus Acidoferrales bacterium]|nr:GMC family oxidoreductase [Candidatus Acidoferrales bacterium]
MRSLPRTDVVVVGAGWTGLLMAKEIAKRTALHVVVLERGAPRHKDDYVNDMDELDYNVRFSMMQDYSKETVTLRYTPRDTAIPIRQLGNFLPGNGTGGAGEHWSAVFPRHVPDLFEIYSKTVERYGAKKLPEDHAIVDWGINWAEIEPYYTKTDKLIGTSGKAGNLRGKIVEGGNPFEGSRSEEYPTPPMKISYFSSLFQDAAKSLGYHPYPSPSAILSTAYTNPDGIARPGCFYCGFCDRFGCMVSAKSQPTNTLLPILERQKSVALRNNCSVRKVVYESNKARGVNYVDARGEECFQPADAVLLCSWTLNNTRLLLLSGIGEPYDPATGRGVVGRNLTHQVIASGGTLFMEKPLNRFMGAAASGICIGDFDGDNFDHSNVSFIRGGMFRVMATGFQPIANFGTVPPLVKARWGSAWKKAAIHWYDRVGGIGFAGEHIPYRANYMDLDPTYRDHLGDPLLRLTLDWRHNERAMVNFASVKGAEMARAMGAKEIVMQVPYGHYDARRYQSTHIQGGTIMGKSPETSVVNTWGQHWQAHNLFLVGASTMPCQGAANPTPTVLALAYRTADALVDRYLKNPGLLA